MTKISTAARLALEARRSQSLKTTRVELEAALRRLVDGAPTIVESGRRISPLSVCKEAGVDRSTLYRYHEPVLAAIRRLNEAMPRTQLKEKRSDLARMNAKLKEYRQLTEQAQSETAALARINYRLQVKIKELEELLQARDSVIRGYQETARDRG